MIDIKPKSVLEQPIYMLTKATSCPYLTGKVEKRIATDISNNKSIYEELSINGFRRVENWMYRPCLLYTSPSPRDGLLSRMPSSA